MPSTNENIDYNKFAKYTIQRWQERQDKAKIKGKGELRRSFVTHVQRDSNGDLQLMAFTFHFYGWYVDAGVGRGIRSGMEEASRRKKPWFKHVKFVRFHKFPSVGEAKLDIAERLSIMVAGQPIFNDKDTSIRRLKEFEWGDLMLS
jgi:hypothetical protein